MACSALCPASIRQKDDHEPSALAFSTMKRDDSSHDTFRTGSKRDGGVLVSPIMLLGVKITSPTSKCGRALIGKSASLLRASPGHARGSNNTGAHTGHTDLRNCSRRAFTQARSTLITGACWQKTHAANETTNLCHLGTLAHWLFGVQRSPVLQLGPHTSPLAVKCSVHSTRAQSVPQSRQPCLDHSTKPNGNGDRSNGHELAIAALNHGQSLSFSALGRKLSPPLGPSERLLGSTCQR